VPWERARRGRATGAEDEIGAPGADGRDDQRQLSRVERPVGVTEGHDRCARRGEACGAGGTEASLGLYHHRGAEVTSNVTGPVGRAVVDHHGAEVRREAAQHPRQRCGLVEHREHDVHGNRRRTVVHDRHRRDAAPYEARNIAGGVRLLALQARTVRRVVAAATVATAAAKTSAPRSPLVSDAGGHRTRLAAAGWVAAVAVALAWGTWAVADSGVALRAAPLYGRWRWHAAWGLMPAVLVGGFVVACGPAVARRVPPRLVPPFAGLAAMAWTVALAAADGWSAVTAPLTTRHEYEPFAARIDDLGGMLGRFAEGLAAFPIHVQGHPPGPLALAWLLDHVGLGGAGWLAAVAIAGWGAAVAAALVAVRAVAGDRTARRAAPALVVLPAAVWAGTSLDALFAGLAGTGLALAALAAVRASRGRALAAGFALGVALLFSYGVALMVAVATVVITRAGGTDRRARPSGLLAPFAVGVLLPLGGAGIIAGFWWIEGLRATGSAYWSGIAGQRPAGYLTLVGNPAALALAAGPAVAIGLAHMLTTADRRTRLLPGAVLAAVIVANLSQMSRGEVERIWLPFVPWLALAAPGDRREWLAAQAGLALLLGAALISGW
jgi:methylthioxylose transferase